VPRWRLMAGRPVVELEFARRADGERVLRRMVADTGAGRTLSPFHLILKQSDVREFLLFNDRFSVRLGGALMGTHPCSWVVGGVRGLPLGPLVAVAVPDGDPAFRRIQKDGAEGIAGMRFLDGFSYGNFGFQGEFGIEPLS